MQLALLLAVSVSFDYFMHTDRTYLLNLLEFSFFPPLSLPPFFA
jgi:hypothetical protein